MDARGNGYDVYRWYVEQFGPEGFEVYEEHDQGDRCSHGLFLKD